MNGNSNTSKELSTRAAGRQPHLRWRVVIIALVLALVIGGAGEMPQAQAAPAGQWNVFFSMVVVGKPKTKLRCKETVTYSVKIEFEKPLIPPPTPTPGFFGGMAAANINVMASSANKDAGDFINNNSLTTVATGDDLSGLLVATFQFKANKPGTTILTFEAEVQGESISTELPVNVLPCKFKVKTNSKASVPGEANINIVAISGDAEITEGDGEGPLTGSTSVNLVLSMSSVLDCHGTSASGSSNAELSGSLDDNGQLTLDVTYQTANITVPVYCVGSDGGTIDTTQSFPLTPDPVHISVASSGGVLNQSQAIQGPGTASGEVTISVIPVEDQAAALIPGNPLASWNDASSLFGLLLALY